MNNERLIALLIDILLDTPENPNAEWLYFSCPFCHHHKQKFAFNINTLTWKCWICQTRGNNIFSLLRRLNKWHLKDRTQLALDTIKINVKPKTVKQKISLPDLFVLLSTSKLFILKTKALRYLSKREIGKYLILKYNIGVAVGGKYCDRVIIPSYSDSGVLNYFVSRSLIASDSLKYLNPKVLKDRIVMFLSLINWKYPIIITEGVFDAITVNFNSVPLLGKTINNALLLKLIYYDSDIYLSLDNDAKQTQQDLLVKLASHGLNNIHFIELNKKDPNLMGRIEYWDFLMKHKKKYTQSTLLLLMQNKLVNIFK